MSKWIAEFELEDSDTMPEHMDLEYKGAKIDFHCRPKEPVLDKVRAEIMDTGAYEQEVNGKTEFLEGINYCLGVIDKYKAESEDKE